MRHFRQKLRSIKKQAGQYFNAWRHSAELTRVQDNTGRISNNTILLITCIRNEAIRLPYFLDYHRALGVGHFLLVDNNSTDNLYHATRHSDVSVWHTTASYKRARYGTHWTNYLRNQYGYGHWCLTLDPDELIVYPFVGERGLSELCAFLESTGAESLHCRMIDMYARGPVSSATLKAGQNPLEVCPWFDAAGYDMRASWKGLQMRGGARSRLFFKVDQSQAPNLVKVPLIRWRRGYAYVSSTHGAVPHRLNSYDEVVHPTGVLLHFKLTSNFAPKIAEELLRHQYYGKVHAAYAAQGDPANIDFWYPGSARYTGWQSLEAVGLLQRGSWA
jgi:hypothetical protein